MDRPPALVLSCEHGGKNVPRRWRRRFEGVEDVLSTHQGWDPGALDLARRLARDMDAPLVATTVTRLLVDANRSDGHPRLFSRWTRGLTPAERESIVTSHHRPHREAVAAAVSRGIAAAGAVLHMGVHSFTPVLDGRPREVDLGVLYDPSRVPERGVARTLLRVLRAHLPELRIRANAPYRGVSDGLTTTLRSRHPPSRYSGLELEVGQNLLDDRGRVPERVCQGVARALRETLHPRAWAIRHIP